MYYLIIILSGGIILYSQYYIHDVFTDGSVSKLIRGRGW